MAFGSNALRRSVEHTFPALALLALLVILLVFALTRTAWRPTAPLRLAHRRAWGQILSASTRMYFKRFPLFIGLGVLAIPIAVVVTLLQAAVLHGSGILGVGPEAESGGLLVFGVFAIGTALTLFGLGLVQAATVLALVEIDEDRKVGPVHAYRLAFRQVRPLLRAVVIFAVAVSLLLTTVFLVPIAIWLAVRWALIVPVVELEPESVKRPLRRSARLVRHGWFKVGSLVVAGAALALLAGPFLGALLILVTSVPLAWLNVLSGIVYAVAMPFVALATAYVYFDMRIREELAEELSTDRLPAEIELST